MQYCVHLLGISWDDGKGEYDVSRLPTGLEIIVEASSPDAALQHAMTAATDDYGSLIKGVEICAVNLDAG